MAFENLEWKLIAEDLASKVIDRVAQAEKELTAQLQKTEDVVKKVTKSSDQMGSSWKETAKGVFAGAAAWDTAKKAAAFLKDEISSSITKALEYQRVNAQLGAALISTGNNVGFTKQQLQDYAEQLSGMTALDNEAIVSVEAMLVTFTNIRNEGFKKATEAVVDMATAMQGGGIPSMEQLRGVAIQVGKALNDPARGAIALTRAGVTLTESQKNLIEQMQKTGNMAGAQQVVLDELSKEFSGSAALAAQTYEGKLAKLSNAIDDVKKNIGIAILSAFAPYIDTATEAAQKTAEATKKTNNFQEIIYTMSQIVRGAYYSIQALGKILGVLIISFINAGNTAYAFTTDVIKNFNAIKQVGLNVFGALAKAAKGEFSDAWDTLKKGVNFDMSNTVKALDYANKTLSSSLESAGESAIKAGQAFENAYNLEGLKKNIDQMSDAETQLAEKQKTIKNIIDGLTGGDGKTSKLGDELKSMSEKYKDAVGRATEEMAKLQASHTETTDNIKKKISELKASLADLESAYKSTMGDINKSEAEKVVEQEQKLADLRKQLSEAQSGGSGGTVDASRVNELQDQLTKEQAAYDAYMSQRKGLDAELTEARRRANETDFQRYIEDLNAKRAEAEKDHKDKLDKINTELAEQETSLARENAIYEAKRAQYVTTQQALQVFHDAYIDKLGNMRKYTQAAVDDMNKKLKDMVDILGKIESAKNKAGILDAAGLAPTAPTSTGSSTTNNQNQNISITNNFNVTDKASADAAINTMIRQLQLAQAGSQ